uniref:Uncharacterized protein n=1 Tax=Solanum lycopersicum TaxID=4081 RepID=A0A3Q7I411_SOLLC
MSKPNALWRFTRGYTTAMELEKKSNDELVRSSPSKRKVVSTVKAIEKKCYKRRKVKIFVPDMIGEPVVNEEQDEMSEESHSSSIFFLLRLLGV